MNDNKCIFCGQIIPEGRQVCPACERRAVAGKLNRAEIRRIQKETEKKSRVYTVTDKQLEKMVKRAALEMLDKGIREFRDEELPMIREDVRKILSLYQAIYRDVLGDMGLLTRENVEEVLRRTGERWDRLDALIANRNIHEVQKYANELGADEDTFIGEIFERKGEPREIAAKILEIEIPEEEDND